MDGGLPYPQIVEINTDDNVTLRCRRYRREGARAVLCAHGQASTGYEFDLPLEGFNLAEKLYALGYEVWIMNFRGAGHPPWKSDSGGGLNSGDQQGALDLPAVIDRVVEETGQPCFYIGHSFGGMSAYIYLQGTVADADDPMRFGRDEDMARERNQKVACAMTAGSPIALSGDTPDWMEKLRRHRWTQALLKKLERRLLRRAKRKPTIAIGALSLKFGFRHPWLTKMIMSSPFMKLYLRPEMMGPQACGLFGTWAGGDVTCLHVAHTLQTVRLGDLCSMNDEGKPWLNYSEGMKYITTPLAAAAGTRDMMRATDIQAKVLGAVSSEKTLFLPLNGCGHCDMLYHLPLEEIMSWMEWAASASS